MDELYGLKQWCELEILIMEGESRKKRFNKPIQTKMVHGSDLWCAESVE